MNKFILAIICISFAFYIQAKEIKQKKIKQKEIEVIYNKAPEVIDINPPKVINPKDPVIIKNPPPKVIFNKAPFVSNLDPNKPKVLFLDKKAKKK